MDHGLQLGTFELSEQIGEGGMGSVYRACHEHTGVTVAIKVIHTDRPAERIREAFFAEVQAQAELVHPNVVYLFEYGQIPPELEAASCGELTADSHFVAMEFADRGVLGKDLKVDDWSTLRAMLVQVLDALAYAHARGVIHRDLKPENLLVFDVEKDTAADFRLKVADFGIAHSLELASERETAMLECVAGTPHYMAPEQIEAKWRSYGPWTDLYALGCITWQLVCGSTPFNAPTAPMLLLKHCREDRPKLRPHFPVPSTLQDWIHRAMAIDPTDRFQRAADALRALPSTEDFEESVHSLPGDNVEQIPADGEAPTENWVPDDTAPVDVHAPTLAAATARGDSELSPTVLLDELPTDDVVEPQIPTIPAGADRKSEPGDPSIVPRFWSTTRTRRMPLPLIGTGLSLFELRETPFINRDSARDHIWQALQSVNQTKQPHLVAVIGESGTGKSRLVEWMTIRAHELGAAQIFRAVHTAEGQGPAEGFAGMIRRKFQGWKIDRAEMYEHLFETLPPLGDEDHSRESDVRALTELVFPTNDGEETLGPNYRFSSPRQKFAVLARLFRRFARRRPAILWLDDAQWNSEALRLAEFLLEEPLEDAPLLVLTTLRSDVLAEQPDAHEQVDAVFENDRTNCINLNPLSRRHHRQLIDRMLPLQTQLAERIVDRTEGNPLFATQLLGDWIDRDLLAVGEDGFRLAEDVDFEVPDDVHQLWMNRLDRVVKDVEEISNQSAWWAIERAATLGREVNQREWEAAWKFEDRPALVQLREALVERGLADRTDDGFAFAHGLLVDSIQRRMRHQGTWDNHHLRCTQMLEELYDDPEHTAARRAAHLMEADELEAALDPLFVEQRRLRKLGDHHARRRVLARRQQIFDRLGYPDDHPNQLENDVDTAICELTLGEPMTSVRDHIRKRHLSDRVPARVRAKALYVTAWCHYRDVEQRSEPRRLSDKTIEELAEESSTETAAILLRHAWLNYVAARYERTEQLLVQARPIIETTNDSYHNLRHRLLVHLTAIRQHKEEHPEQQLRPLLDEAQQKGYPILESTCLSELGELARFQGDAPSARRYFRRYREAARERGEAAGVATALVNLTQVELSAENLNSAAAHLEEFDRWTQRYSEPLLPFGQLIEFLHLALAAGNGHWSEFDRRLPHAQIELYDDPIHGDHPWLLELTADFTLEHGESERAKRALQLARRLWDEIGNDEEVERIGERLDQL